MRGPCSKVWGGEQKGLNKSYYFDDPVVSRGMGGMKLE